MQIEGSVALVTGARRGMGREYVTQLLDRGAAKVYAGVRDGSGDAVPGAQLLPVDVTDAAAVARAAHDAADVSLLVNNAGISTMQSLVTGDMDQIRAEMDVHFYGTLRMIRAFAPVLARREHSAIVNMLSALSWSVYDGAGAYSAAKAAAWSLTDMVRLELAPQHIEVLGVYMGAVDTDMMAGYDGPMEQPRDIVAAALDALERGDTEALADEPAIAVKRSLSADPRERYPQLATR